MNTNAHESIQKELLALENKFWQAIKDKDVDTALSLTSFPCIVAGAQGVAKVDRESFVKMMEGAKYTLKDFKLGEDAEVNLISDDVAVLAYSVHEELIVDGKTIVMDASDASTWVHKNGNWVCALHTESLIGDPYGRDRSEKHVPMH